MEKNYSISIGCLKAGGKVKTFKDENGNPFKCIVIPIRPEMGFFEGTKDVYWGLNAWESENGQYGDTHYLKPQIPNNIRETMTEEQKRNIPIIGNMKPKQDYQPAAAVTPAPSPVPTPTPTPSSAPVINTPVPPIPAIPTFGGSDELPF